MIVLSALGGYIITSYVFLKYPGILHKKKDVKFKAVHISHRGGAGENLENTMAAFQHAVNVGTQMLEIDCHITRDGHVVVSHDNSLNRTAGMEGCITDTDYQDLPPMLGSLRTDFEFTHVTVGGEDRRIPLLREVFEKFPDLAINIDIKINNDALIHEACAFHFVNKLIVEFKREHLTVWGNGSKEITDKCHKMNPSIGVLFSVKRVLLVVFLFYSGLLPFVPLHESFYEVLMPGVLLRENKFHVNFTSRQKFFIRLADTLLMNRSIFQHLSARGIQTYLWVLNDREDFERAFRYGVTGVMTDFPSRLTEYMDAKSA
ncbi:hypothetical protein CAPTEDRAFT_117554 [Capitella teleta]|uniref:GP-PDE domain-containing protein n=1 Tax=Capitella teleta TaxID=283909 RepID=R7THT0_CAPTE|nr:hypothetical protein CAPTEDRAFT_117554 [Capitella teleta]|eukprot:ELT91116.1 hypothetical protein CAPTEDRAFT_117554 [Capitella teleta]